MLQNKSLRNIEFMKPLTLTLLILAVFNFQESKSQLRRNLDDITRTTETIKSVFGKKKNKSQDISETKNTAGNNSNDISSSGIDGEKSNGRPGPGDIAPNARFLEVDEMESFDGGAAIVKRGEVNALIDASGNLITPFTKYTLMSTLKILDGDVRFPGYFILDSASYYKTLNAKGKFVGGNTNFFRMTGDGKYAVFSGDDQKYIFIDAEGKKFTLTGAYLVSFIKDCVDGLGPVQLAYIGIDRTTVPSPYVYINLKGQIVINGKFESADKFSEGLACVSKKNDYGEIKYGFIDMKGSTVIPFNYSNKPTNFNCGLSRIIPKDLSDFKCAFINKKGEIVIKCPQLFSDFSNGYAFRGSTMMDTTGKVFTAKEFFATLGINPRTPRESIWIIDADQAGMIHDGKIRFERTPLGRKGDDHNVNGYFDLATKKVVPFSFINVGKVGDYKNNSLWFDPVSKLAYAERYLGEDKTGKAIMRKGYINEEGIFVIVMKAPDTRL